MEVTRQKIINFLTGVNVSPLRRFSNSCFSWRIELDGESGVPTHVLLDVHNSPVFGDSQFSEYWNQTKRFHGGLSSIFRSKSTVTIWWEYVENCCTRKPLHQKLNPNLNFSCFGKRTNSWELSCSGFRPVVRSEGDWLRQALQRHEIV